MSTAASAQTPSKPKAEFEVASVRPSAPVQLNSAVSVGLKMDGQHARFTSFSLRNYIAMAYQVSDKQVMGPDSIEDRFDVQGTLPPDVKADRLSELVEGLLRDRFQLKIHRESRDLPAYVISIGKPPLQLKEVVIDKAIAERQDVDAAGTGSGNGVAVNLGNGTSYTFANNKFEGKGMGMGMLADQIGNYLDHVVVDQTGLTGRYDFAVEISQEDYQAMLLRAAMGAGYTLPPFLRQRVDSVTLTSIYQGFEKLGLKLDQKKTAQPVIVVDGILKAPTEN